MVGPAQSTDEARTQRPTAPPWGDEVIRTALAAAGNQLGRPQTQHLRSLEHWQAVRVFVIVASLGIAALCCGTPGVYFSDARALTWVFPVVGVLLLALAYVISRITQPRKVTGVVTFEGGLVIVDDGRPTVVPWSQLHTIRMRITDVIDISSRRKLRRTKYDITLDIEGHPPFRLTDQFVGVKELTDRIDAEVTARRLPEAIGRVRQGETLRFGRYGVGPQGLDDGSRTLPFGSVRAVEVAQGWVTIRTDAKRPWSSCRVADIPNPSVFVGLVRTFAGLGDRPNGAG